MAITLKDVIKMGQVHAGNIEYLKLQLIKYFPVRAEIIKKMPKNDLMLFSAYLSHFAILQAMMGNKIFPLLLKEATNEETENMTFIDMINRLEKLEIVQNTEEWKDMRKIRNRIAHHYPDKFDEMAELFNDVYNMTPKLLDCLNRLNKMVKKL